MRSTPIQARTLNALRLLLGLVAVAVPQAQAQAQLDDSCVVSVLNRTSYVQADGSWVLPNTPANIGRVRVRATCVKDGVTRSGQSEFFQVPLNGVIKVPEIRFDEARPVPSKLVLSAPQTTLGTVGATVQAAVLATYPDGSTADATSASQGTNYTSSNPAVATVSAEGLVTAQSSGTVIVTALNDGALALLRVQVVLSGDTDGDGIPDDVELANGLNPNDPVDALEDFDADGLTNRQELELGTDIRNADTDGDTLPDGREVELGTEPLVFDTDGDGLSDGLEVSTGSDPLDPSSYNLAQALSFIEVQPTAVVLVVNTLIGEASRQLSVTGHLIDNTTLNLASTGRGTNYASSNLSVVSFGLVDGQIFAGANGLATVTVSNAGFSAAVPVTVRSFAPSALSALAMPGYANNVDVAGNTAYVAAGSAGLQVVDVTNRLAPLIVGALDTPGVAIDVRVVGTLAYVADGTAGGLRVIDVSNPAAPLALGALDTPGDAQDLVVRGTLAYVADGPAGLQIIDVSNPTAPVLVGALDTPGLARGVDVTGTLAVVADGTASLRVIDVSNPAAPVLRGSVAVPGDVKDVTARERYAYVPAYTGSLQVVDLLNPNSPAVVGSVPGFVPRDLELTGRFGLAAEQLFPNVVAIVDTTNPASPSFPAVLNFAPLGDYAGTGIAADASFVYMTGESFVVSVDYGVTGNTRLFIGQYLEVSDEAGLAPTVAFTAPPADAQPIAGSTLTLRATASDDVAVASVTFALDGVPVGTDFAPPYEATLSVPTSAGPVTLTALALDFGGNLGTATRAVVVVPDPPATVVLTAPAAGQTVYEGAALALAATASDNGSVTRVRFLVNGTLVATDTSAPYTASYAVELGATSLELVAEATDNLGQVSSDTRTQPVTVDPPPVVAISAPALGEGVVEGADVDFAATAVDNVQVTVVRFFVNGEQIASDTTAPYGTSFTVPLDVTSVELSVQASDNLGRVTSVARTVAVSADPPPVVELTSPAAGQSVMEGATLALSADASDNVEVTQVRFLADGTAVAVDGAAPYTARHVVALGATSLTVAAEATDNLGRTSTATRVVAVTADPRTTVVGTVVDPQGQPVEGASVRAFTEFSGLTAVDGSFSLPGVVTARGDISVFAEALIAGHRFVGRSAPTAPVPGGTTAVGTITLQALSFETEIGALVDPDLFGNLDDGSALIELPFAFSFYGVSYADVYVGTNGYVSFGTPDTSYSTDVDTFAQNVPRIAPKMRDWASDQDPDGAGIYVNTALPDRVVITWKNLRPFGGGGGEVFTKGVSQPPVPAARPVAPHAPLGVGGVVRAAAASCDHPEFETACSPAPPAPVAHGQAALPGAPAARATAAAPEAAAALLLDPFSSTFQVVLYADGHIQIGYDGAFVREAIVGLTPGGGDVPAVTQSYDFSSLPSVVVDVHTAPYEAFSGFPDSPFDLDHSFLLFEPDGVDGYTGGAQVPIPLAPVVEIVSPAAGDELLEGQGLTVSADASDDVLVTQVVFTIDGTVYDPLFQPPYEVGYELPLSASSVTIQASAHDNQGQTTSTSVTLPVLPDPPPTVAISAPPAGTTLVEGETISLVAEASDNIQVALVGLSVQGLALAPDTLAPYARTLRVPQGPAVLSASATASDNLGRSSSVSASYTIVADPLTSVHGTVVDVGGTPVAGANVSLLLHGLKGEFFHFDEPLGGFPDLTGLTPDAQRLVSSLDYRNPGGIFGTDTFGVGLGPNFAARFTATLQAPSGGGYVFTVGANDGARLLIDGTPVAEAVGTSYVEVTGERILSAGAHALEVLYFQNDGDAELQLSWTLPGEERDAMPSAAFLQPAAAFSALSDASGVFELSGVPTRLGLLSAKANATVAGEPREGQSAEFVPVRGGITELGNLPLLPPVRAVGYYDLDANNGSASQVAPITAVGLQAVNIGNLASADLSAVQMLFVQNANNGGYATTYRNNLAKVASFVSGGGVLIFHDRHVDTAETILPGVPGNILRDFADASNVQIVNATTSVTNGPGGVLNDGSLDGGNSSTHGYVQAATIPAGALGVLSRGNAAELILYAYRHGQGWVVYSTIPLDFYLGGSGPQPMSGNMRTIYAPNVLQFGRDLKEGRIGN